MQGGGGNAWATQHRLQPHHHPSHSRQARHTFRQQRAQQRLSLESVLHTRAGSSATAGAANAGRRQRCRPACTAHTTALGRGAAALTSACHSRAAGALHSRPQRHWRCSAAPHCWAERKGRSPAAAAHSRAQRAGCPATTSHRGAAACRAGRQRRSRSCTAATIAASWQQQCWGHGSVWALPPAQAHVHLGALAAAGTGVGRGRNIDQQAVPGLWARKRITQHGRHGRRTLGQALRWPQFSDHHAAARLCRRVVLRSRRPQQLVGGGETLRQRHQLCSSGIASAAAGHTHLRTGGGSCTSEHLQCSKCSMHDAWRRTRAVAPAARRREYSRSAGSHRRASVAACRPAGA